LGAFLLSLIGFVDVSSLLLVRAESRRREIAVRGALGATRTKLVRQFAVEGFLLAGAGVISYSVGQRTREIGVRMALGAQRPAVYQLILKEACWLTVLGIGGGILGSAATASLGRSMLFGVSPLGPGNHARCGVRAGRCCAFGQLSSRASRRVH
jgi:ABC-type antimicrobial peptide transport system permease subunit